MAPRLLAAGGQHCRAGLPPRGAGEHAPRAGRSVGSRGVRRAPGAGRHARGGFLVGRGVRIGAARRGLLAGPMVFNWRVAVWFDRNFVAMDLPDPHDVETTLEVGAWTWNYMEPILGTASFMLLAFQVARTQLMNAGLRPYRSFVYELRAQRVAREFPKYDERLVRDFAMQSARLCKLAHQQQS